MEHEGPDEVLEEWERKIRQAESSQCPGPAWRIPGKRYLAALRPGQLKV
jgi:hypothetical protein